MFVDGRASGNADLLGKYTATFKAIVNLACGCSQGDSIQFVAPTKRPVPPMMV